MTLDGADVLYYTPKGNYGVLKDPDGKTAADYHYLAICKYPNDNNYYLFCCSENYEVENDWFENSAEACMKAASAYNINITWNKVCC